MHREEVTHQILMEIVMVKVKLKMINFQQLIQKVTPYHENLPLPQKQQNLF